MAKPERSYWREADARRALAQIDSTGESDAAYERRSGVPASRLRWWRKRLEEAGGSVALRLLPVRVRPAASAPPAGEVREHPSSFEIAIGSWVVRVPPSFDEAALARLVRTLGQAAC